MERMDTRMNVVENEVRELVRKELAAANTRFPAFASDHEGYAVVLEEYEEALKEMQSCELHIKRMWEKIMGNTNADESVAALYAASIRGACEMIQLAAMARKFIDGRARP